MCVSTVTEMDTVTEMEDTAGRETQLNYTETKMALSCSHVSSKKISTYWLICGFLQGDGFHEGRKLVHFSTTVFLIFTAVANT